MTLASLIQPASPNFGTKDSHSGSSRGLCSSRGCPRHSIQREHSLQMVTLFPDVRGRRNIGDIHFLVTWERFHSHSSASEASAVSSHSPNRRLKMPICHPAESHAHLGCSLVLVNNSQ
jgi:hypothetical protein